MTDQPMEACQYCQRTYVCPCREQQEVYDASQQRVREAETALARAKAEASSEHTRLLRVRQQLSTDSPGTPSQWRA